MINQDLMLALGCFHQNRSKYMSLYTAAELTCSLLRTNVFLRVQAASRRARGLAFGMPKWHVWATFCWLGPSVLRCAVLGSVWVHCVKGWSKNVEAPAAPAVRAKALVMDTELCPDESQVR